MTCTHCHSDVPDGARYCPACGVSQRPEESGGSLRRLARSRTQRRVAGVCGGLAEYLAVDVTFVRAAWVIFSVVPGAIIGGVLAYLLAWLVVPDAPADVHVTPLPRSLSRSETDRRIAGVCGGLAEYFGVDSTPIRLLWVILSIVPGAIAGGLIAYGIAWLIIPRAHSTLTPSASTI